MRLSSELCNSYKKETVYVQSATMLRRPSAKANIIKEEKLLGGKVYANANVIYNPSLTRLKHPNH